MADDAQVRSPHRDAIRALFVLVKGAELLSEPHPSGAIAAFRGEARLHAFHFWMRYPDYLAEELLDKYEATRSTRWLREAESILDSEEPEIRRFPMIRFRFGAYERLDDTLMLLRSRNLVLIPEVTTGGLVRETDFLVMPKAFQLADEIVKEFAALGWYAKRAALVAEIAGSRGGHALKQRQYEQAEYAETQLGGLIPPIATRVRGRLETLRQAQEGREGGQAIQIP